MGQEITISKLTAYYLNIEEEVLKKSIVEKYKKDLVKLDDSEVELLNETFYLTTSLNPAYDLHSKIIDSLIVEFIRQVIPEKLQQELFRLFNIDKQITISYSSDVKHLPDVLESIHTQYLNTEFSIIKGSLYRRKSKHHLKESGAVYTLKKIANEIVEKTIEKNSLTTKSFNEITCLDFASGTGRFYFEALDILTIKYGLSVQDVICRNLYAIDIDEVAIKILRLKAIARLEIINSKSLNSIFNNILVRNGLMPKTTLLAESSNGIDFFKDFPLVSQHGGFDVIFSNPPYYLLKNNKKANKPQLAAYYTALQKKLNAEISFFKTSGVFHYSIEGMLNYYQLSIEMILNLTKNNGHIGIICPSTLFADLTSSRLRKHLLNAHKLYFIRFYPESALLFDNVAQSTAIFFLQKKGTTDKICVETGNNIFNIDKEIIKKAFPINNEIPSIQELGWKILDKLSKFPRLKDFSFIRNKRGELDLTLFKSHITGNNTGWRLVRGNMISNGKILDKNGEFVQIDSFLEKKSKEYISNDFNKKRLICQQISNIDSSNRLKFTFCEPNDILGNSCNYIVSTRNENDLSILHYLLNSKLLNWRFKVSSSNNHINNYEIDELPVLNFDILADIDFSKNQNTRICELFGLSTEETNYIIEN